MLLVAPFLACWLLDYTVWAWVILGVSGATDFLDGKLARHLGQVTSLGKVLDPAADKITQAAVAVGFAVKRPILLPLLGIFLCKEFLMLVAAVVLVARHRRPCGAKWYGKVSTAAFYLSFITLVALGSIWHYESVALTCILLSITAGFMIYAFIRYLGVFVELLRSNDPKDILQFQPRKKRVRPRAAHPGAKEVLAGLTGKTEKRTGLPKEP